MFRRGWAMGLVVMCGAAQGETFALLVGVEHHRSADLTDAPFAAADATALRDVLAQPGPGGLAPDHLELLVAGPGPEAGPALAAPTRAGILLALKRLALRAGPQDTLLLYYAGHGIETASGQFLLAVDSNPLLAEETAVPVASVRKIVEEGPLGCVILLVDACRNDPYASRGPGDNLLSEGMARGLRPRPVARGGPAPAPLATLLACGVGERAWGWPEEGHGAFTRCLLEGLRGAAAPPGSDGVRLSALAGYVQKEVTSWAASRGRRQTPLFDNPAGLDPILARPTATGVLTVESEPSGALVTLNGLESGRTPCRLKIDLGPLPSVVIDVGLHHAGRRSVVQRVTILRGGAVTVRAELVPAAPPLDLELPPGSGFLGVELRDAGRPRAEELAAWPWLKGLTLGALVARLVPDSPAAAQLAPGMVIVRCDGDLVHDAEELAAAIRAHRAGDTVRLMVLDGAGLRVLTARLGIRPGSGVDTASHPS